MLCFLVEIPAFGKEDILLSCNDGTRYSRRLCTYWKNKIFKRLENKTGFVFLLKIKYKVSLRNFVGLSSNKAIEAVPEM